MALEALITVRMNNLISQAAEEVKKDVEKIGEAAEKATKKTEEAGKTLSLNFRKIREELKDDDKTFEDFTDRVEERFADVTGEIRFGILDLLDEVREAPPVFEDILGQLEEFPEAIKAGFGEFVIEADTSLDVVKNLTSDTAKEIRSAFKSSFVELFEGDVHSLEDVWKDFTKSMKDLFIDALADMAASFVTSALFDLFSGEGGVLGFSAGGLIPEDGLFAGEKGELVLSKSLLSDGISILSSSGDTISGISGISSLLGDAVVTAKVGNTTIIQSGDVLSLPLRRTSTGLGALRESFLEIFPGFGAKGAGLAAFAGGFGGSLLGEEIFGESTESSIGSTAGGIAGSLAAATAFGPIGIGIGAFLGAFGGAGIGDLFDGAKLHAGELEVAGDFDKYRDTYGDSEIALALARLENPDEGGDSIADALEDQFGKNLFPGTNTLREDDVDKHTIEGFKKLIDQGIMTRAEIEEELVNDLVTFKGKFAGGLNFVPYDDFPALLHRGERVLTESENRGLLLDSAVDFSQAEEILEDILAENQAINRRLDSLETTVENTDLDIKVVTVDGEVLVEQAVRMFAKRLASGEITIDASAVTRN